ncbi:hypothetical protein Clacol_008632 [Clathrus columnatus]|uniref:NACHT domain-containing protein n=1 Tax=Clathrus columnatus TaxID=1419009 RepID=A0AAV5ANW4_9AGAM|nr:hypothetical protein Clacol_008632 [Clathrus columnatus]
MGIKRMTPVGRSLGVRLEHRIRHCIPYSRCTASSATSSAGVPHDPDGTIPSKEMDPTHNPRANGSTDAIQPARYSILSRIPGMISEPELAKLALMISEEDEKVYGPMVSTSPTAMSASASPTSPSILGKRQCWAQLILEGDPEPDGTKHELRPLPVTSQDYTKISGDTLKPSAIDICSETLDSSLQAARHALIHTRTITGKQLEHDNKPGYYGQVGLSVVNRLSVFADSVKMFADMAFTIISGILTAVTDTQGVDQSMLDLFETLDSVYKFIEDATEIKKHPSYERIMTSLAQQTVECAYFIRDYAKKKNFWIRVGRNAIGKPIKLRVQSYQGAFGKLLGEFQTRSALHTEITVSRLLELNQSTSENLDLDDLPYASGAGLSTRKQCLPGTRVEVLNEIIEWINDADDNCPRLFWLAGPAGVGKSAIAHSIALRFKSIRRLGSFFCFDRNQFIDGRRDKIFPTIARDLADLDSQIKHELAKIIKNETSLRKTPDLQLEWEKFILEPLHITSQISTGPILVVIDALDESGDPTLRRELLKILEKETSSLPVNIRFLVTSRPEKDITLTFNKSHIRTKMMNTIPDSETNRDILSYFKTTLEAEIADGSFTDAHLKRLVALSQGLFQWAFLASNFLTGLGNSAGSIATERYENLISAQRIRSINDPLDVMYNQILSSLFDSDDPQVMTRFRSVIGSIVTASEPLSLNNLVVLRGENIPIFRRETDIKVVIQYMGSLLSGIGDPSSTIRPLHLSFREYLLDKSRSGSFWIDPSQHHREFAFGCLRTMSEGLRFNICDIPDSHIRNIDDESLPERILSSISSQLSYSCRFWVLHVSSTAFNSLLAEKVEKFLHRCFLLWLEVLSLLKAISGAGKLMSNLISWCSFQGKKSHETLYNFAVDGKRFIQLFGNAIAESAPHVYLSALPFCPQDSVIYKTFIDQFPNIFRIASGPLHGWPLGRRRIDSVVTGIRSACFSHGGQYLAVGLRNGVVKVLDSETLETAWVIESPHEDSILTVEFSTGDKSLVFTTTTNIYSFDILTGVMTLRVHFPLVHVMQLSHDAKFVALCGDDPFLIVQNLETKEDIINISTGGTSASDFCYGFSNTENGTFAVYLGKDVGVQLWSLETGALLHRLQPPPDFFNQQNNSDDVIIQSPPKVSLNGEQIIFNRYGCLYIWNLRDNSLTTLQGYGLIGDFTMTPDGDCISIQVLGNLILHDMNGDVELRCETTTNIFCKNIFSKDGKRLIAFDSNRLDVLDLDEWRSFAHIHHSKSSPRYSSPPVMSPDGKYFFIGTSGNKYYEIWDFEKEQPIQTLDQGVTMSSHVTYNLAMSGNFSPMSRYFGYVLDKQNVGIYDIRSETTKHLFFPDQEADLGSIAFSQDETLLATLEISHGTVYIFNIDSAAIIDFFDIPKSTELGHRPKFKASPTLQYFAYTFTDGGITLFNRDMQLIPLDSVTCEPFRTWSSYDTEDFVFSLDEERILISRGSKIFHINLVTAESQAVTLQGISLDPSYTMQRSIYFTSRSEARLFEGAKYENDMEWRWGIWDALSGRLIYSVSPEYPDEFIQYYTPVHQCLFTSSSLYERILAVNTKEDDQTRFSSNKQHSLRDLLPGSSARLRPDGWVVTQNDEILFWVPQEYHQILHLPKLKDIPDLTGKVIVVTGAYSGIGYETAKELLRKNAKVYFACRDSQKTKETVRTLTNELKKETIDGGSGPGLGEGVVLELDLSDLNNVKRAAMEILSNEERIDVLINNAGVMLTLLIPALERSTQHYKEKARVINVSSAAHTFPPDKTGFDWKVLKGGIERDKAIKNLGMFNDWKLYDFKGKTNNGDGKGNVLMANFMARQYGDKFTSCSLNPGGIRTNIQSLGAYTSLFAATIVASDETNGKFFQPWGRFGRADPRASNVELQDKLKEWLEKQVEEFEKSAS